jgi:hypothetical protein
MGDTIEHMFDDLTYEEALFMVCEDVNTYTKIYPKIMAILDKITPEAVNAYNNAERLKFEPLM